MYLYSIALHRGLPEGHTAFVASGGPDRLCGLLKQAIELQAKYSKHEDEELRSLVRKLLVKTLFLIDVLAVESRPLKRSLLFFLHSSLSFLMRVRQYGILNVVQVPVQYYLIACARCRRVPAAGSSGLSRAAARASGLRVPDGRERVQRAARARAELRGDAALREAGDARQA